METKAGEGSTERSEDQIVKLYKNAHKVNDVYLKISNERKLAKTIFSVFSAE